MVVVLGSCGQVVAQPFPTSSLWAEFASVSVSISALALADGDETSTRPPR